MGVRKGGKVIKHFGGKVGRETEWFISGLYPCGLSLQITGVTGMYYYHSHQILIGIHSIRFLSNCANITSLP